MNARSILRVRTPWSAAARVEVRPPPRRLRCDGLVAVDAKPGAALTSEEKRILARDAAVLSAFAIAALAVVLLILERAYA